MTHLLNTCKQAQRLSRTLAQINMGSSWHRTGSQEDLIYNLIIQQSLLIPNDYISVAILPRQVHNHFIQTHNLKANILPLSSLSLSLSIYLYLSRKY